MTPSTSCTGGGCDGLWDGHPDVVLVHSSVSLCTAAIQGVEGDMGAQKGYVGFGTVIDEP